MMQWEGDQISCGALPDQEKVSFQLNAFSLVRTPPLFHRNLNFLTKNSSDTQGNQSLLFYIKCPLSIF